MSNIKELRELPIDQLEVIIEDLNKDIFELRNQLAMMRKVEKPHLLRDKKRDKARTLMVLSEKKKKEGEK